MKVALVRVGIDTGAGGIHAPLFADGTFEYIPIPDCSGVDTRTYGTLTGRRGRPLCDYFPRTRQARMVRQPVHVDPEFGTFTYGDPSVPKSGLRHLRPGDLLVFFCGLEGWDHPAAPALYLLGYFEVAAAGRAGDFTERERRALFGENFHVRHECIYRQQEDRLVLVKGSPDSRLFERTVAISETGRTRTGKPLKVLSREMRAIFGGFDGRLSFQRSPTRWVDPAFVERAAAFVRSLK
jgi:hypothetical protein